jgi:hypothetical protein
LGEGLVEHADRVAAPQNMVGTEIFIRNPSVLGFPAADDLVDLRRQTVALLRLRPSTDMRSVSPRPHGRLESHMVFRLPASALPRRCFPNVRRHLQRALPAQIRPYPRRRKPIPQIYGPPVDMSIRKEYQALKISIGLAEREILTLVYK